MPKVKTHKYLWSTTEKNKLVNRYKKFGWAPRYYKDFGCSWATCKSELKRLGYIKED